MARGVPYINDRHERWGALLPAAIAMAAMAMLGCTVAPAPSASPSGTSPSPESSATILPVPSITPGTPPGSGVASSPVASATAYVVAVGDTLSSIAERFGVTVSQILAANPELVDPDQIQVGDTIVIPPPDAPSGLPPAAGISDPAGDLVDAADQPAFGPGYSDISGLGVQVDPLTLYIEVVLVGGAPALDPEVEQLDVTVHIDTDGDDQPEVRMLASNTLTAEMDYGATVEVLETGLVSEVTSFPGTFTVGTRSFIFEVSRSTLGNPRSYAVAAALERRFYPGGLTDPEVEATIDRSPDQQYPRANPRWVEVGR